MSYRVAITGIGVISPIGLGVDEFWKNACAGKTNISVIPEIWKKYYKSNSLLWSLLPIVDYSAYNISRIELNQIDKSQAIALACANMALIDSGFSLVQKDERKNTFTPANLDGNLGGVFVGTGIGGVTSLISSVENHTLSPIKEAISTITKNKLPEDQYASTITKINNDIIMPMRFHPFSVSMTMPNASSAAIGIKYGITGPNTTYATACSSGTVAIGNAANAIAKGQVSWALCGGVEYPSDETGGIFRAFDTAKTLVSDCSNPNQANCPFDKKRSGFLFAEGGGAILVLENEEDAKKRGARIYAYINSYAENFEAHSMMMLEASGKFIEKLIGTLLSKTNLKTSDIDYINTHGTGTLLNDEIESRALSKIFGKRPLINSTKSLIGHTIGASGAIEAAVCALSLYDNIVHESKNIKEPIADLNFAHTLTKAELNTAISESFAFGGHNAALLFTK